MPRTITVQDDHTALGLDLHQLGLLDRALGGYTKALQASRDMGVISHETFCHKSDRTRAVQYQVWEIKAAFEFEIAKAKCEAAKAQPVEGAAPETPSTQD